MRALFVARNQRCSGRSGRGHKEAMTSRAALLSDRLYREGNSAWHRELEYAVAQGTTLVERIERRIRHWERLLKMHETEEETT